MPKPTKLHTKGKTNSIQKPCKVEKNGPEDVDPEEARRQFQVELCWCIQKLERTMSENKGTEKQMLDAWKVLSVLKNNNQPMIRKRQLMRTHFGDYRSSMAEEEKKLAKLASKIKISEVQEKPKATFLRKSAFLTTGDSSFRFNFNLSSDQVENNKGSDKVKNNGNLSKVDEEKASASNTKEDDDGNTKRNISELNPEQNVEETTKKFKFAFSDSQFKFNFQTDNSK